MKKAFLTSVLLFVVTCPVSVFAYEPTQTHAGLTEQVVEFYLLQFGDKITTEQKELIITGAMEEDTPPERALNHFYDPVRNIGINGYRTAKDWALVDSEWNQYSWNEVIRYYAEGNEREAFLGLGHILHLLEDMGVPDHTRNDQHLPFLSEEQGGHSPYEDWAAINKNRSTLRGLAERYVGLGYFAKMLTDLGAYFDFLAKYSNENFFSRDTIGKETYQNPKIVEYDFEYGYTKDSLTGEISLLVQRKEEDGILKLSLFDKRDTSVLSSYFDRLAAQIIPSGAGVIQLFFEEGERARKEYEEEKALQTLTPSGLISSLWNRATGFASGITDGFVGGSRFLVEETANTTRATGFSAGVAATYAVDTAERKITEVGAWAENQIDKTATFVQKTAVSAGNRFAVIPKVLGAATEGEINIPEIETQEVLPAERPKAETPQRSITPDFTSLFPVPIIGGGGGGGAERTDNVVSGAAPDTTPPDAPVITTPSDFSRTFMATSITFSGTAEAESMIATDFGSATTTTDVAGNWTLPLSGFSEGTSTVKFYAADQSGNISAPTSAEFFIDATGPDISLTISSCADSVGASECLIATTTVAIEWNTTAADIDHFVIDWRAGSFSGSATSTSFIAGDNTTIIVTAEAYDTNGNRGPTATKTIRVATLPVVINEVAWMGTAQSPADEWIELYNPTDTDIALSSFTLFADSLSPYLPLSGYIPARGYYLIERKNTGETNEATESPIIDIPADLWTSFGGGLSNLGERVRLARTSGNATTTVDEISYCGGWCGYGTTHLYKTMERVDAGRPGTDWTNWGTNIGTIKNGNALFGIGIFGTPKARNYMSYLVNRNQNIANNSVLVKNKSPYLIDNTVIYISAGKTLTIEPGVVIKFFNNAGLVGNGSIIARGTESDPIVFTSFYDDAYGGDTNQDGLCDPSNASSTTACPFAGAWRGVDIFSTSIDSVFDHTIFRYGGENSPSYKQANLSIEGVSPVITNSVFEYAGKYGVTLSYASSTVSNNIFRNNKNNVFSCGLSVNVSAPTVSDNTFSGNRRGLCLSSTAGDILNNTFTNNINDAITSTHRFAGRLLGNTGSGNGKNGISFIGELTKRGDALTLEKNDLPYLVVDDTNVSASSTLTMSPNTITKFGDRFLRILGSFIVPGPALFTSVYDDSDGNDALNDGPIPAGIGGLQEIRLESGSSSDIKDAEFRYFKYALSYTNSPISLENVLFYKNAFGIIAGGGTSILKAINVSFVENTATSSIPLP